VAERAVEQFGGTQEPMKAALAALAASVPDGPAKHRDQAADLAELALKKGDIYWYVQTAALARYRKGHPEEAAWQALNYLQSPKGGVPPRDVVMLRLVATLGLTAKGKIKEARDQYDQACRIMDAELSPPGRPRPYTPYGHAWALDVALRREAEQALRQAEKMK
jgi:hypothetical protein